MYYHTVQHPVVYVQNKINVLPVPVEGVRTSVGHNPDVS